MYGFSRTLQWLMPLTSVFTERLATLENSTESRWKCVEESSSVCIP